MGAAVWTPEDVVREGIHLFNDEFFFEAHEVLEDLWRSERGEPRLFLQGLIQIAAAFVHLQNGNLASTLSLLGRGADKMRPYPSSYLGIGVAGLLSEADGVKAGIEAGTIRGPDGFRFPRIRGEL